MKRFRTPKQYSSAAKRAMGIFGALVFMVVMISGTTERINNKNAAARSEERQQIADVKASWVPATGMITQASVFDDYNGIDFQALIQLEGVAQPINRVIPAGDADKQGYMTIWDCKPVNNSCTQGRARVIDKLSSERPWDQQVIAIENSWHGEIVLNSLFGALFHPFNVLVFGLTGTVIWLYHRHRTRLEKTYEILEVVRLEEQYARC